MSLLRKIFFYLFVAIYLVCCPLLVLYGLGYTFKPGAEQEIIKSGLVYLSTAPLGASMYLNNRRYTKKTPAILSGLLPGDYQVSLVLKNYRPWIHILPVEAGKATVLERILLLPEEWKRKILSPDVFEDLVPISDSRFFLLTKGLKAKDLFIYDWKEEKARPLFPEDSSFLNSRISARFQVKESPAFLLRVGNATDGRFLWVVPKKEEIQIKDVTDLFLDKPHQIEWDPQVKKYLFAFQNDYLNRVNLALQTTEPKFLDHIRGYGLFEKKLYVLKSDNTFERIDFDGKWERQLLRDPALGSSLFGEKGNYQVKVFSDDIILFLGEKGELLGNRLPYRFVEEGVLGLEFYPKLKRVLIWKKDALGVLDFSKQRGELGEKEVFESGPKLIWVFKKGEKIEQAFWVYEGSHILFRDGDKVFLLELETYGKPHLNFLVEVKHRSSIFYSEDLGKLYYLDNTTGNLTSMEILPRWEILPLPFPERKEEKKKAEIGEL